MKEKARFLVDMNFDSCSRSPNHAQTILFHPSSIDGNDLPSHFTFSTIFNCGQLEQPKMIFFNGQKFNINNINVTKGQANYAAACYFWLTRDGSSLYYSTFEYLLQKGDDSQTFLINIFGKLMMKRCSYINCSYVTKGFSIIDIDGNLQNTQISE